MTAVPPPIIEEGRSEPRQGWFRTWTTESEADGIYWLAGYKMGRAWLYHDERWMWVSWCRHGGHGLVDSKDEAKRMVEAQADLTNMSISCMPGKDHRDYWPRFEVARAYWKLVS